MKPVIFVIDGAPGSGKTKFAKTWLCEDKGAYFHAAPENAGRHLATA